MIYPIWTFRKCDIQNVNKGKTVLKCAVYQYANEKAVVHSKYPLLFSNHKSQVQLQAVNWKGKRHHFLNCYWKEAKIECFTTFAVPAAAGSVFSKHKRQSPSQMCEVAYLFLYKMHFVIFAFSSLEASREMAICKAFFSEFLWNH